MAEGLHIDSDEVSVEGAVARVGGVESDADLLVENAFLVRFVEVDGFGG